MKRAIVFLVVALAIPTSVALAKGTPNHGKSNPRVMYVLKGALSSYQAASSTADGSISITVNHSNYHGRLLKGWEMFRHAGEELDCLIRQPGRAFTRHQLMDAAIGEGSIVLERTIDVHVKTLRKKLGDGKGSGPDLIETVRGVGYRFREGEAT